MENPIKSGNENLIINRRRFIGYFSTVGLGSTLMPGALLAVAQDAPEITVEMVETAAKLSGLSFSQEARERIASSLNGDNSLIRRYEEIREMKIENSTPPAIVFNPVPPGMKLPTESKPLRMSPVEVSVPQTEEQLAFMSVRQLAELIKTRAIKSMDLTKLYLARLKKYDPILHCVISLTEEFALKQAQQADEEIAAGSYRGPLHGIPWGAKDLLAVKGYRTTFGASPYKDQVIDSNSTVFTRLTEAGAVLVAKLTLGALAQGDRWFGGQTKSPWDPKNPDRGSSGSSAGPGSATAAGLVGFSIGTETRGSIISPSSRCGVTGLRPTFGRVSRSGAMALSWSMDKIGPMCRSAEDCALVLGAINGPDGRDISCIDVPFNWDAARDVKSLRIGYLKSLVEGEIREDPDRPERAARIREQRRLNGEALSAIRSLGIELKAVEIPDLPSGALGFILSTESAAAFDDLTRSTRIEMMSEPPERSRWGNSFRLHRFVPAVEYIQANRARFRIMQEFHEFFADLDLFIGSNLGLTNLTGHPEISLPHGFDSNGQPGSLRITGKLFGDEEILLLAHAYQNNTNHHLRRPAL
jgi:Asp-tRNA(Asn)/Glu-tRNA(Gln) amidotransferase A subunit family amidase